MAFRWQYLKAKFKNRLSLSDLHEATDGAYEMFAVVMPEMHKAIKESEPNIDYRSIWSERISGKLLVIAEKQTRRSQALECRKLLIKAIEDLELSSMIVGAKQPLLTRTFFKDDDHDGRSDDEIQSIVAKQYVMALVDQLALITLYREQFNSTLNLSEFEDTLREMCKMNAEFLKNEAAYMLVSTIDEKRLPKSDSFFTRVVKPAITTFEPVIGQFKENLCLLSPLKPDIKPFNDFREKVLSATQPFLNK